MQGIQRVVDAVIANETVSPIHGQHAALNDQDIGRAYMGEIGPTGGTPGRHYPCSHSLLEDKGEGVQS